MISKTKKTTKKSVKTKPQKESNAIQKVKTSKKKIQAQNPEMDSRTVSGALKKVYDLAKIALDKKAENIKILDVSLRSGYADYLLVLSTLNEKHSQSLAQTLIDSENKPGIQSPKAEGLGEGRWVLIDFQDVVVHIFLAELRHYYGIEELWRASPEVQLPQEFFAPAGTRISKKKSSTVTVE